jgi:hypothetical protein
MNYVRLRVGVSESVYKCFGAEMLEYRKPKGLEALISVFSVFSCLDTPASFKKKCCAYMQLVLEAESLKAKAEKTECQCLILPG